MIKKSFPRWHLCVRNVQWCLGAAQKIRNLCREREAKLRLSGLVMSRLDKPQTSQ